MAKKKPTPVTEAAAAEYTVLARRYRPQQFADLVGQEPIAQSLCNAIASNRVAHAYLFTGARGVGKTSTARILAKSLNCVNGPTATPCGECDSCKAIATGEDIDVLEIDGASNRGIDEVRELRQNVQFRPSRSRYKIYIIDEVHMLTREAFNALLKTLEEPPPHVKFIFATTEVQKIPITILSRCQRFDFAGIGTSGIVERLASIVTGEGLAADPEALDIIARRAGGSMRDAQSLLDQLLAFGGDKLTAEGVHRLLGTANEERVGGIAGAVLDHAADRALQRLDEAVGQGLQLGELLDQLIEYWRDLMVVNCAGVENQTLSVTGKQRDALKEQAQRLNADTIIAGLDVLVSARNRMRYTSHGRVLFEMALVRLSGLDDLVPLSQLAQWVNRDTAKGGESPRRAPPQTLGNAAVASPVPVVQAEKKKVNGEASETTKRTLSAESLEAIWQQLLSDTGLTLSGQLRRIPHVAIFGPNTLVMRLPPGYNSGDPYLDATRLAKVEEALTRIVGQPCSVRLEAAEASQAGIPPGAPPAAAQKKQRSDVGQVPLVGKVMQVMGGQIVHMDENFGVESTDSAPPPVGETTEEG